MSQEPRRPLDATSIRDGLTPPWRRFDVVAETGSTNADLLARSAAGEDIDGAVLVAEHQSAGRGRQGRTWSAPPRSQIAMSMGISVADVLPQAWGWLPLLTGVAVVDVVRRVCGIEAGLKWPNDVLVGTGKLAGILVEVASPRPAVVIGLGLNVTVLPAELPDTAATSLLALQSRTTDRNTLCNDVLREIAVRITSWRSARSADDALIADYRRLSVTLGTPVRALLPGDRQILGTATDIDELGRLSIDTGDDVVTIAAGDITHLRPAT